MPVFATVTPPTYTPLTLTALAAFKAVTTPRNCTVSLYWWQSVGVASAIRASDTSATMLDSTSLWLSQGVTATAPSDATLVSMGVSVAGCSASEQHACDNRGIFPGTVTQWSAGGYVGSTTATFLYSDDGGATWLPVRNGVNVPIPSTTQVVSVEDYEAIPSVAREYEVLVETGSPALISAPSTPATATVSTSSWWIMDPTSPATAFPAFVSAFTSTQMEQSGASIAAGRKFLIINADTINGQDGTLTIETVSAAESATLQALVKLQKVLWLTNPFGEGHYVRLGPQPGGMASGNGNKLITSTLNPSETINPYRTFTFTYVEQPRP